MGWKAWLQMVAAALVVVFGVSVVVAWRAERSE